MVIQRFIQQVPEFNAFINNLADGQLAMDRELLAARGLQVATTLKHRTCQLLDK